MKATYIVHVEAKHIDAELLRQILNMSLSVAADTYKELTGQECKLVWAKA